MGRHVSFWIGFFAAAFLIVPIALFAWGLAQERLFDLLAMVFGGLVVLVVLLIVGLVFRGPLLRRVLGRSEASVDEITRSLVAGVSAAATGDVKRAEAEADTLTRVAIGWYAWSNFYRWVIGSCIALLVAFATFTGSVLLFEQNKKIGLQTEVMAAQTTLMEAQSASMEAQTRRLGEQTMHARMQNEILTVTLVSDLRAQILSSAEPIAMQELAGLGNSIDLLKPVFSSPGGQCALKYDLDRTYFPPASQGAIAAIASMAESELLGERVIQALEFLLMDGNASVALSALKVLDMVEHPVETFRIRLDRALLQNEEFSQAYVLDISHSFINLLSCTDCELTAEKSIVMLPTVRTYFSRGFNLSVSEEVKLGIFDVALVEKGAIPDGGMEVIMGDALGGYLSAYMDARSENELCEDLAVLADRNPAFLVLK